MQIIINGLLISGNDNLTIFNVDLNFMNSEIHGNLKNKSSFRETFLTMESSFSRISDSFIDSHIANFQLNESSINWEQNSQVSLRTIKVIMEKSSKWDIIGSVVYLVYVNLNFSKESRLILNNCDFDGEFVRRGSKSIEFGENSTLTVNYGNIDYIYCTMNDSIIIPENARYTEADVSSVLNCQLQSEKRERDGKQHLEIINKGKVSRTYQNPSFATHYNQCAIGEITTIPATSPITNIITTPKATTTSGSTAIVLSHILLLTFLLFLP